MRLIYLLPHFGIKSWNTYESIITWWIYRIVEKRSAQRNFQLLVITHDEDFLKKLFRVEKVEHYLEVKRDNRWVSLGCRVWNFITRASVVIVFWNEVPGSSMSFWLYVSEEKLRSLGFQYYQRRPNPWTVVERNTSKMDNVYFFIFTGAGRKYF